MRQGEVAQAEERVIASEPNVETLSRYLESLDRINAAIRGMQERHVEFIRHIMDSLISLRSKAQKNSCGKVSGVGKGGESGSRFLEASDFNCRGRHALPGARSREIPTSPHASRSEYQGSKGE